MEKIKILLVTAEPDDSGKTRADRFCKAVAEGIAKAEQSVSFDVKKVMASDKDGFYREIETFRPHILHLYGHGDDLSKFYFETSDGKGEPMTPGHFAKNTRFYTDSLQCVLFSMCHSYDMAQETATQTAYAVGNEKPLLVDAALLYSQWFYFYIANGSTIPEAHEKTAAKLEEKRFAVIPELIVNPQGRTCPPLMPAAKSAAAQSIDGIPRLLTERPFMPEVFLGRKADLEAIKNKLFSGDNMLLLVNGNGGVGKTSLAARYYDRYQNEYTHAAWVLSQKSIANALLALATPLKVPFEDAMPTAERLTKLLAAMANLTKPCLLVIDNANEIDDLKENYLNLRRCTNFHLLITSRINHFEKAQYYHIEGLPYDDALKLFAEYYPKHSKAENALFKQIHTAVGGNTLVVELLAKYLNAVNGYRNNYTLANLLTDLQTRGLLGLATTKNVAVDYHATEGKMREEKPEDIVAAMYDLGELGAGEKALLSLFAILPAEAIAFDMLETLTGNAPKLEDSLDGLVQKGWIEKNNATNEFRCNPLVQEIARKKNPQTVSDCETLIHILTEKLDYDGVALTHLSYADAAVFARYAEGVVISFDIADYSLSVLTERLGNYHYRSGDFDQALHFFNLVTDSFKKLFDANPKSENLKNSLAISYSKLGDIYKALGDFDQALHFFNLETDLFKELFDANPKSENLKNGLAISYSKLGAIYQTLGDFDQALQFFNLYNHLSKELFEANPKSINLLQGLVISHYKLAMVYKAKGDDQKGMLNFAEWKRMISSLTEKAPQIANYRDWNKVEY